MAKADYGKWTKRIFPITEGGGERGFRPIRGGTSEGSPLLYFCFTWFLSKPFAANIGHLKFNYNGWPAHWQHCKSSVERSWTVYIS